MADLFNEESQVLIDCTDRVEKLEEAAAVLSKARYKGFPEWHVEREVECTEYDRYHLVGYGYGEDDSLVVDEWTGLDVAEQLGEARIAKLNRVCEILNDEAWDGGGWKRLAERDHYGHEISNGVHGYSMRAGVRVANKLTDPPEVKPRPWESAWFKYHGGTSYSPYFAGYVVDYLHPHGAFISSSTPFSTREEAEAEVEQLRSRGYAIYQIREEQHSVTYRRGDPEPPLRVEPHEDVPNAGPATRYVLEKLGAAVDSVDDACNYLELCHENGTWLQVPLKTKQVVVALEESGIPKRGES